MPVKKHIYCLLVFLCLLGVSHAAVSLPWECSFTTAQGVSSDQNMPQSNETSNICGGLKVAIDGSRCSGNYEQILTAADNSVGAGGRGQRHYRYGYDVSTGGSAINFGNQTHVWIRYYMRFSTATAPTTNCMNSPPPASGTCDCVLTEQITSNPVSDFKIGYILRQSGTIHLNYFWSGFGVLWTYGGTTYRSWDNAVSPFSSSYGWDNVQGGSYGSGNWDCYEFEIKLESTDSANDGLIRVWLNGQLFSESLNIDIGTSPMVVMEWWGNNQYMRSQSIVGNTQYNDFDDLSVASGDYPPTDGWKQDTSGNNMIGPIGYSGQASDTTPPVLTDAGPIPAKACDNDPVRDETVIFVHTDTVDGNGTSTDECQFSASSGFTWDTGTVMTPETATGYHKYTIEDLTCGATYTRYIKCRDTSENQSAESTVNIQVESGSTVGDTTAPVIGTVTIDPSSTVCTAPRISKEISFSATDAGASNPLTCKISQTASFDYDAEGTAMTPDSSGNSGDTWRHEIESIYCGTSNNWYVKCRDSLGNTSAATTVLVTVDMVSGIAGGGSGQATGGGAGYLGVE